MALLQYTAPIKKCANAMLFTSKWLYLCMKWSDHPILYISPRCTYKTSKDKTSKDKPSKDKTSKDKTSTHQNVDTSKRRQLQNVDMFFFSSYLYTRMSIDSQTSYFYWFTVIIFRRIFCIYLARILEELSSYQNQFKLFLVMTVILSVIPLPPNLNSILA
jgi:hypothetical protein